MRVGGRLAVALAGLFLSGCQEPPQPAAAVRPVRASVATRRVVEAPVVLTGQIQAREEASLAFRIAGRVVERLVEVGAAVGPDDVIARLDPRPEQDALQSAEAALAAARAGLVQAGNAFERQRALVGQGFTTRVAFDQAEQQFRSAEAQVTAGEAQLRTARDRLGYTELRADAAGIVTAKAAEPGEVVAAGQTVVRVARLSGRDAVFEVPAGLIREANRDLAVTLALTDDPAIRAVGRVREIAPQADPATRTFRVRVGLAEAPPAMRLGAVVTGTANLSAEPVLAVPASALTQAGGRPAVWVVDRASGAVAIRPVDVLRYEPAGVVVAGGLEPGEVVVTSGVQALRPGQTVRLLGDPS